MTNDIMTNELMKNELMTNDIMTNVTEPYIYDDHDQKIELRSRNEYVPLNVDDDYTFDWDLEPLSHTGKPETESSSMPKPSHVEKPNLMNNPDPDLVISDLPNVKKNVEQMRNVKNVS